MMAATVISYLCRYVFFCLIWSMFGDCQDFAYDGDEGPSYWGTKYAHCIGKRQSPINIQTHDVTPKKFPPLKFKNFQNFLDGVVLANNGHTVMLTATGVKRHNLPTIRGGPLNTPYIFRQLHFHWGPNDTLGSENQINSNVFPMEIHVVMYNAKYGTFEEALNAKDGLTVLAFLTSVSPRNNEKYDKFEDLLRQVHPLASNKTISNFVPLDYLISEDRQTYYTYEGSLTTPPCSEIVTWIEFPQTVHLSREQINSFRSVYSVHGGLLTRNYRPLQAINNRTIYYYSGANVRFKGNMLYIAVLVVALHWNSI